MNEQRAQIAALADLWRIECQDLVEALQELGIAVTTGLDQVAEADAERARELLAGHAAPASARPEEGPSPVEATNGATDQADEEVRFRQGDIVRGTVTEVSPNEVFLALGPGLQGVVPVRELSSTFVSDARDFARVGDEVDVFFLWTNRHTGLPTFSIKRLEEARGWVEAELAKESEQVVYAVVQKAVPKGVLIDVFGIRTFLPASFIAHQGPLEALLGRELPIVVTSVSRKKEQIRVSNRKAQKLLRAHAGKERLAFLEPDQVVQARVERVADYGALVDIDGLMALLPISEMSWHRVAHPSEVVKLGDVLSVQVIKVDRESFKIAVSLKLLQPDPWKTLGEEFAVGQVVEGKVVKLAKFGAFVELKPGVEVLLPAAELAEEPLDPNLVLVVGQRVRAQIVRFTPEIRRMAISLRAPDLGLTPVRLLSEALPGPPEGASEDLPAADAARRAVLPEAPPPHPGPEPGGRRSLPGDGGAKPGEVFLGRIQAVLPDGRLLVRLEGGEEVSVPTHSPGPGAGWRSGMSLMLRGVEETSRPGFTYGHVFRDEPGRRPRA